LEQKPPRVLSIDVFRGITIVLMIFVNHIFDLRMKNIPQWLKHMPALGITMSDIIFPAFLFIVGMAIPLALDRRIDRGDTWYQLIWRVVSRAVSILIAGFYWVNYDYYNASKGLLPKDWWGFLAFISVILIWINYPQTDKTKWDKKRVVYTALQGFGFVMLIFLSFTYTSFGEKGLTYPAWTLDPRWWQMLGAIGWAYLFAGLYYLVFRNNLTALAFGVPLFLMIYTGHATGVLKFVDQWVPFLGIRARGTHGALVMAGIVLQKFMESRAGDQPKADTFDQRVKFIILFGGMMLISGFLEAVLFRLNGVDTSVLWWVFGLGLFAMVLYIVNNDFEERMKMALSIGGVLMLSGLLMGNLYKISKNGATPSWVLVCSGTCVIIYVLTYYFVDQKKMRGWFIDIVLPPANNPLLAYLMPEAIVALLLALGLGTFMPKLTGVFMFMSSGILGILRAVLWTALMIWLTMWLTKQKVVVRF